jgi:hypothetical protein
MSLLPDQTVLKEGTFLYDGLVECDIRIVHGPVRFGSGDHSDPEDVRKDLVRDTYYLHFGSTTERGVFNAGGGAYDSLDEAIQGAMNAPGIGRSIRWSSVRPD